MPLDPRLRSLSDTERPQLLHVDSSPRANVCAADDERECWWTSPWFVAAQNANWCVPEVR